MVFHRPFFSPKGVFPQGSRSGPVLIVALGFFHPFVTFLRLDAESGDGARLQPAQNYGFAGLLALSVAAVFDAHQRLLDFTAQLARLVLLRQDHALPSPFHSS